MHRELRILPGLICIQRSDGYFIGHLNDQIIFPNVNLIPLLRKLQTWQTFQNLKEISDINQEGCEGEVTTLLEQLEAKGFLEWRNTQSQQKEIIISHMNEIGLALAPILYEEGFAVATLDKRSVRLSDVRGSFIRVANLGEKFDSVLNSQIREIINSRGGLNYSERNLCIINNQMLDRNSQETQVNPIEQKTLVVITSYPEPELLASLMEREIPHIFVSTAPGGAYLGPLVRPGQNPCFHCIELHRSDRDRKWQNVALTLFTDRLINAPMASALFAAAIAAQCVLASVREEITLEQSARTTIFRIPDLRSNSEKEIREESHTWNFHPSCSCHWEGGLSTRAR